MKEVKRSVGSAIKVLLGNMVIILEMIFEMPTASESSISILEGQKMSDNNPSNSYSLLCPLRSSDK